MIHSFDIEDAVKYGMTEAVILYNLRFWIEKNKANNKHFHDGRYWTYNSVKAFEELFPYLTYRNIRSSIEKLERLGVIITGNFNQSSYDRTRWFALFDLPILTNGFAADGKTVNTDINTDIKTDTKANVICDAKDALNCPHQEIINLYHEILPTCPRVKDWTQARKAKLKARWKENEKRQNLSYWKRLFEYVSDSDFLMGRTEKPFHGLNLEWIVTQANFTKIIEQNYENR